jgi:hypothetical protein
MRLSETVLVGLDEGSLGALFRGAIGFATIPIVAAVTGNSEQDWALVPGFLMTLILLRVVPLVIRKLMPFSSTAQQIWGKRRQMAKRYDSYQWRKLFWSGAGMALYSGVWGASWVPDIAVAGICIMAGGIGLARWRVMVPGRRGSAALSIKEIGTVA